METCICVDLPLGSPPARVQQWADALHPYMAERIHKAMALVEEPSEPVRVQMASLDRVRSRETAPEPYGTWHKRTGLGLPCGCRGA